MHQLRTGTSEHNVSSSERTNQCFDLVTSAQPDWYGVVTYCLSLISSLVKLILDDMFPPLVHRLRGLYALYVVIPSLMVCETATL